MITKLAYPRARAPRLSLVVWYESCGTREASGASCCLPVGPLARTHATRARVTRKASFARRAYNMAPSSQPVSVAGPVRALQAFLSVQVDLSRVIRGRGISWC